MRAPTVRLSDLVDFDNGYAFRSEEYVDSGYSVIRISNVQQGYISDKNPKYVSLSLQSNLQQFVLSEGDILMSLTGNVGRVGQIQAHHLPAVLNQRVARIRITSPTRLDKAYLFYFLNSENTRTDIEKFGVGVAQLNVSTKDIGSLAIPLPPLAEQRRVAEQLDTADRILRLREQAIKKLDQLAQSVFGEMFGKQTKQVKLKEICSFVSGGTPSKDVKHFWNGEIAWISSADIEYDRIKTIRHYITGDALHNSATNTVPKDSVLVVTRTGVGKVIVTDSTISFSQDITGVLPTVGFSSEFIAASIRSKQSEIVRQARGATIKGIARDVIANIDIPNAPQEKQLMFSDIVKTINSQKLILSNSNKRITNLFHSLQHQAFAIN